MRRKMQRFSIFIAKIAINIFVLFCIQSEWCGFEDISSFFRAPKSFCLLIGIITGVLVFVWSKKLSANEVGAKHRFFLPGLIFSFVHVFGSYMERYNLPFSDIGWNGAFIFLGFFLAWAYFFSRLLRFFYLLLFCRNGSMAQKSKENVAYFQTKSKSGLYFRLFIPIVLVSVLWYIALLPGVITYDSYYQMCQALGWCRLSNGNPVFHTLLISLIADPVYKLTNDVVLSAQCFQLFQVIVLSSVMAYVFYKLICLNCNRKTVFIAYIFYLINPSYGVYMNIIWKDIWISYFLVLFSVQVYELIVAPDPQKCFSGSFNILSLFISSFCVLAFKGTGIIFIFTGCLVVLCSSLQSREKTKIILLFCMSSMVFFSVQETIIRELDAGRHNGADTKCLIWQSTALICKEHADDLSEEEKNYISCFMDMDKAADAYKKESADPVKNCLHYDSFRSMGSKAYTKWLQLILRFPDSFFKALWPSIYGYCYTGVHFGVYFNPTYYSTANDFATIGIRHDPNAGSYAYDADININKTVRILLSLRSVPVLYFLTSVGWYFDMLLVIYIFSKASGDKASPTIMFLFPLATFISCVLSPLYAEMRYAYPAVLSLPAFLAMFMRTKDPIEYKTKSRPSSY